MADLSNRLGRREKKTGQVLKRPEVDGLGAELARGVTYSNVHVGGGFFYLLPPGKIKSPDHDALVALANKPAPAPAPVPEPMPEEAVAEAAGKKK